MTFVPSVAGINHLIHNPSSIVGRYLERTGERVLIEMEGLAPVGEGKDGHLYQSMERSAPFPTADGQAVRVGSRKRYAAAVVRGSKPHLILPRNASVLRFRSKAGTVIFARSVQHPGYKGDNFMVQALRRIIHGGGGI